MADTRMQEVQFQEGYRLDILLDNGHRIIYNLEPKLVTARFQELASREAFYDGYLLDGKRICWKSGAELTLDEILLHLNHINTI